MEFPEYNTEPGEKELATFIESLPGFESEEVHVYSWRDKFGGYRISELAVIHRNGDGISGASWMQSDSDCAKVLFAAERFIISRGDPIEDFGDDVYVDYEQEQEQNLRMALEIELPEWEDRRVI